jgi:hypothetical protein
VPSAQLAHEAQTQTSRHLQLVVPAQREAPADPAAVGLLTLHASGQIHVVFDAENFDFHVDVAPDVSPKWIKFCLQYLDFLGYEMIPLSECDPELLENDWVRRYFAPREAVNTLFMISPPVVGA